MILEVKIDVPIHLAFKTGPLYVYYLLQKICWVYLNNVILWVPTSGWPAYTLGTKLHTLGLTSHSEYCRAVFSQQVCHIITTFIIYLYLNFTSNVFSSY